jgi:hypothetical protein
MRFPLPQAPATGWLDPAAHVPARPKSRGRSLTACSKSSSSTEGVEAFAFASIRVRADESVVRN